MKATDSAAERVAHLRNIEETMQIARGAFESYLDEAVDWMLAELAVTLLARGDMIDRLMESDMVMVEIGTDEAEVALMIAAGMTREAILESFGASGVAAIEEARASNVERLAEYDADRAEVIEAVEEAIAHWSEVAANEGRYERARWN
jgi:hypothetical protein